MKAIFIPLPGGVFKEWETVPGSIASGDHNLATYFHVTGDTFVRPVCETWSTFTVKWGPSWGDVDIDCPGATITEGVSQDGHVWKQVTAAHDMDISLTGTGIAPNTYVTWKEGDGRMVRYGPQVTVRPSCGDVDCEFSSRTHTTWHDITISMEGGDGDIFFSADSTTWLPPAAFLGREGTSSVTHGDRVHLMLSPSVGYAFDKWTWEGGGSSGDTCAQTNGDTFCSPLLRQRIRDDGFRFTAHLMPRVKLTLETQGEGLITGNIAYDYLPGQQVTLYAEPCIAWEFDHWEGQGSSPATSNPLVLTMDSDTTVTTVFQACWSGCADCSGDEENVCSVRSVTPSTCECNWVPSPTYPGRFVVPCGLNRPRNSLSALATYDYPPPCYHECAWQLNVHAVADVEVIICENEEVRQIDPTDDWNSPDSVVTADNYCEIATQFRLGGGAVIHDGTSYGAQTYCNYECTEIHEQKHFEMFEQGVSDRFNSSQIQERLNQFLQVPIDCDNPSTRHCTTVVTTGIKSNVEFLLNMDVYYPAWIAARDEGPPTEAAQECDDAIVEALCEHAIANGWPTCDLCLDDK